MLIAITPTQAPVATATDGRQTHLRCLTLPDSDSNQYTAVEGDGATGQRPLHARYTNGASWLSEEAKGFAASDVNLYRYVRSSPTNMTDPSGLEEKPFGSRSLQLQGRSVIDWIWNGNGLEIAIGPKGSITTAQFRLDIRYDFKSDPKGIDKLQRLIDVFSCVYDGARKIVAGLAPTPHRQDEAIVKAVSKWFAPHGLAIATKEYGTMLSRVSRIFEGVLAKMRQPQGVIIKFNDQMKIAAETHPKISTITLNSNASEKRAYFWRQHQAFRVQVSTIVHELTHLVGTDDAQGYLDVHNPHPLDYERDGEPIPRANVRHDLLLNNADTYQGFFMDVIDVKSP